MRSQDEEFSIVSDKVRKGICDSDVSKYMRNHVRSCPSENDNSYYASGKLSIIVTSNAERQRINNEKLHRLLPSEKTYVIEAKDECTNVPHAPKLSEDLPLTKTGQLSHKNIFKVGAPL